MCESVTVLRPWLAAPCTGTGVLSKRADLRWRRTERDLHTLMRLQASLLDAAACLVGAWAGLGLVWGGV